MGFHHLWFRASVHLVLSSFSLALVIKSHLWLILVMSCVVSCISSSSHILEIVVSLLRFVSNNMTTNTSYWAATTCANFIDTQHTYCYGQISTSVDDCGTLAGIRGHPIFGTVLAIYGVLATSLARRSGPVTDGPRSPEESSPNGYPRPLVWIRAHDPVSCRLSTVVLAHYQRVLTQ